MKKFFIVTERNQDHIAREVRSAPVGHVIRIAEQTRTLDQNAKMWPMLEDIAQQVTWDGERMTKEEWKDWFTAALKKQRMVRGMEGGIVFVGQSTSKMSKTMFSDLIELIYSFGAQQNVKWSDEPAQKSA
jgi:hypothetical protein